MNASRKVHVRWSRAVRADDETENRCQERVPMSEASIDVESDTDVEGEYRCRKRYRCRRRVPMSRPYADTTQGKTPVSPPKTLHRPFLGEHHAVGLQQFLRWTVDPIPDTSLQSRRMSSPIGGRTDALLSPCNVVESGPRPSCQDLTHYPSHAGTMRRATAVLKMDCRPPPMVQVSSQGRCKTA